LGALECVERTIHRPTADEPTADDPQEPASSKDRTETFWPLVFGP
jgi:hypothetical protein